MNNYYYDFLEKSLMPDEAKEYFLESPLSDWVVDGEGTMRSIKYPEVTVVILEPAPGKQILRYKHAHLAKVVFTEGARGIYQNIPVDLILND